MESIGQITLKWMDGDEAGNALIEDENSVLPFHTLVRTDEGSVNYPKRLCGSRNYLLVNRKIPFPDLKLQC